MDFWPFSYYSSREYLGASLTSEEDNPLVKDGQPGHFHRAGGSHEGVSSDAVEVPHIYRIEAPVEIDGLHIDVRIQ